uniref:Uncharacterized protein n=1 Tax=Rhizophora mucronata TaxID=61149 RepID=A0A2P2QJL1_RHIMU
MNIPETDAINNGRYIKTKKLDFEAICCNGVKKKKKSQLQLKVNINECESQITYLSEI